jgi:MarR-like DNA-binding transcriptional regulator SgrR of sgrS sRNA
MSNLITRIITVELNAKLWAELTEQEKETRIQTINRLLFEAEESIRIKINKTFNTEAIVWIGRGEVLL